MRPRSRRRWTALALGLFGSGLIPALFAACGGSDDGGDPNEPVSGELRVESFAPALGSADGGSPIYIQGSGFAEGLRVYVGGAAALGAEARVQGKTIAAVVPRLPPGNHPVEVELGGRRLRAPQQYRAVEPLFKDVTERTGIETEHRALIESCPNPLSTGAAWGDYDADGDLDLYLTHGRGANRLYQNQGDTNGDGLPNFVDVAAAAKVDDPQGVGSGVNFVDFDGDGDLDLFVLNNGPNRLYANLLTETGTASFVDRTALAGLGDAGHGQSSAWADFDMDGRLDVYVANHLTCMAQPSQGARRDRFYRNVGAGRFEDAETLLSSGSRAMDGLGFAPGWFDYDDDGDLDLYVANDNINGQYYANVLWRNNGPDSAGRWSFTDVSKAAGVDVTVDVAGKGTNAMGLALADYDNDGRLDIAFSNLGPNYLFRNKGDGSFQDVSDAAGVRAAKAGPYRNTTWATQFFDYDNDGWLDLFFSGGPIDSSFYLPNLLFRNRGDGTFEDVSNASGLQHAGRARAAAFADFDGDGWVDVFVSAFGGPMRLFRNEAGQRGASGHALMVELKPRRGAPHGIGARLQLEVAGGPRQVREMNTGPSLGAGNALLCHFGLGAATSGRLTVRWPLGGVQSLDVQAGQRVVLTEP